MLEYSVSIENRIVQYFLMGGMFTYSAGMKKGIYETVFTV